MRPEGIRGHWREDEDTRAVFAESASIHRVTPRAVASPQDAEDVQQLMKWAAATATPLVARGSGSSMAGGCLTESVVVDLSLLHAAPSVDANRRLARCGPAVTRAAVTRAAEALGLRFPVDPSSGAFCSVGGMVATNASGSRTLKFGSTRTWVSGLECVLADGTRTWVRRGEPLDTSNKILAKYAKTATSLRKAAAAIQSPMVRKNSSGYGLHAFARTGDLVDLLVGSEGTLAVFTELELALCELPVATATLLVSWPTLEGAVRGAAMATEAGASACELLDRTFLDVARTRAALPVEVGDEAVLLIELEEEIHGWNADLPRDASEQPLVERTKALERASLHAGASRVLLGLDPESSDALWALRHAASPILARLDPSIASMQLVEDACVPQARLSDYVQGVRRSLDQAGVRGVIFGHAGDANVHVNALVDVRHPEWKAQVARLFADIMELTATLGGTSTGEHGDGRLRTPLLNRFWSSDALALFERVKASFDPLGILNPGVKVWRNGAPSWDAIKYDPTLASPSPRAQRVLDRVSRERAYHRSRVEMLDESV
ncbi:MAG: FAD-binding oxidoreductase [Gemmatimonadaceae bacterium]